MRRMAIGALSVAMGMLFTMTAATGIMAQDEPKKEQEPQRELYYKCKEGFIFQVAGQAARCFDANAWIECPVSDPREKNDPICPSSVKLQWNMKVDFGPTPYPPDIFPYPPPDNLWSIDKCLANFGEWTIITEPKCPDGCYLLPKALNDRCVKPGKPAQPPTIGIWLVTKESEEPRKVSLGQILGSTKE